MESSARSNGRVEPSRTSILSGVVFLVLLAALAVLFYSPVQIMKALSGAFGGGRPPQAHIDAAVEQYYQEYFLSGNAIELTGHKTTHVSREHLIGRNVVLYELQVTGTYKEDYTVHGGIPFIAQRVVKQYRKSEPRTVSGRLAFWREGSRWYCCNPDTYLFSDTIYWTSH